MSSSSKRGLTGTVRFRLTVCYALFFSVFALFLFVAESVLLRYRLGARMDDELLSEVREFEALYEEFGLEALADEFRREGESDGIEDVVMLFRSPHLTLLASSDLGAWKGIEVGVAGLADLGSGEARFRTLRSPDQTWAVRLIEACTEDGNILQLGRSLDADEDLFAAYRRVFLGVAGAMLLFGFASVWLLASRAMSGVEEVTLTAVRIGETDLMSRVPRGNRGREIEQMVVAFNEMLDRIDGLVNELKEVTGSMAHDLRSPLTRIRGVLESGLMGAGDDGKLRDAAGLAIEECDRMVGMVNTMLEIAEAHAGVAHLESVAVDLSAVCREAVELFAPVAEDRGVSLRLVPENGACPVVVSGDLARLQRAAANILDNALKYTPEGGSVDVRVWAEGELAHISVTDTGIGLSEEDRGRIFDRFFRADASRSTPGSGLGLPFAKAILQAQGGDVEVESELGKGSRFTIHLPLGA